MNFGFILLIGFMPGLGFAMMLAFAIAFYMAAEFENYQRPILWAGASIFIYLGAATFLGWGLCGVIMLQLALFFWMALWTEYEKHGEEWPTALAKAQRNLPGLIKRTPSNLAKAWDWLVNYRARQWISQGRCPQCGYDLRGSRPDLCPECGADTSQVQPAADMTRDDALMRRRDGFDDRKP